MIGLLLTVALAAEPVELRAGQSVTATEPSVLLSEADFRACWAAKKNVPELTAGLELCEDSLRSAELRSTDALTQSAAMLDKSATVFDIALSRMAEDEEATRELVLRNMEQERTIADLDVKLHTARAQRNTAWAVSGAVVLGAFAVGALAL